MTISTIFSDIPQISSLNSTRSLVNFSFPLGVYTDLLRKKTIQVFWTDAQRLSGRVHDLHTNLRIENLPLTGVPTPLIQSKNLQRMQAFFQQTHFILERGQEGSYNRISVHVTARGGGGEAKLPIRPGLVLGAVVKAQTIEELEKYAAATAQQQQLEQQVLFLEQQIESLRVKKETRVLQKKRDDPQQTHDKNPDPLVNAYDQNIRDLENQLISSFPKAGLLKFELPLLSQLLVGDASPVDKRASKTTHQPRASDSIIFTEQYIHLSETNEAIEQKITESMGTVGGSASAGYMLWKAGAKLEHTSSIAQRVLQIKKSGQAKGILILSATATLRQVECYTDLKYDVEELKRLLDIMKRKDPAELESNGIGQNKTLYILTEAFKGASFTAFVTFLEETKSDKNQTELERAKKLALEGHLKGEAGQFGIDLGGALSSESALKNAQELLRSEAVTQVKIDIEMKGVVAAFERHVVEQFNRHTLTSVLKAYENFIDQIHKDTGGGYVIGFNYDVLTQTKIESILKKMEEPSK